LKKPEKLKSSRRVCVRACAVPSPPDPSVRNGGSARLILRAPDSEIPSVTSFFWEAARLETKRVRSRATANQDGRLNRQRSWNGFRFNRASSRRRNGLPGNPSRIGREAGGEG